jgi:hypothetical protein
MSEDSTHPCAWDFDKMEEYSQLIEQHATACMEAAQDYNAQEAVDELLQKIECKDLCPGGVQEKPVVCSGKQEEDNMKSATFSKRKDVVYKTLLRKVRKYSQKLFNSSTKYLATKRFKPNSYYREKLEIFA